jgi:hypothetical protein
VSSARLEFVLNYQDFDGGDGDTIAVDITFDGGENWQNVALNSTFDYGGFRSTPGLPVSIDLAAALGEPNVRVGFRYVHHAENASDWYAQVDNVRLVCDGGIFFDAFESGDTHAWTAEGSG